MSTTATHGWLPRLRQVSGPFLVGLGVFLMVAAPLIRFYGYPALAKTPTNYEGTTHLEAKDATVIDYDAVLDGDAEVTQVADLEITSLTAEDAEARGVEGVPDNATVWVNVVRVDIVGGDNFQMSTERAAFDEVTGAGLDCEPCNSFVRTVDAEGNQVDTPVVFEGQVYKFPFDTQKETYAVWDGTLGEAVDATYEGEDEIQGLSVYKFVQEIPLTDVTSGDRDMQYAMRRTFYIEPVTGSPVQRIEERTQRVMVDDEWVDAFTGTVSYTDDQVADTVADLESKAPLLNALRTSLPIGALLLGAVLLLGGLLVQRRNAEARRTEIVDDLTLIDA